MKFFIVKDKNTELGPYPEEVLIDMATSGDIDASTLIRNSLMKRTQEAKKIPFLTDHVKEVEKKEDTEGAKVHMKPLGRTSNSVRLAIKKHRLTAFVIDLSIIYGLVYLLAAFLNNSLIMQNLSEGTPQASASYGSSAALLFAGAYLIFVMYYTINIGFFAQTPGQRFYGVMAVNTEDMPVNLQRSFLYSVFFFLLLPLEPFFVYIASKSLHEILSGTKIVNVRFG
ncbi:RDD family protein [Lentisphaera profundi]|uniref:RDD family protein n=1 Tax=Lentisphaera profundi TaxID=1658616 RepID=A0ABY7VV75_9BACT|nr:RDD family protein [Lentisphaera profundi]WDE96731.1 RDD family protein [Lentisphaera profundi]